MSLTLYDPFEGGLRLGPDTCFLSGTPVGPADTIPVFADWLQAKYDLAARPLPLLDHSNVRLGDLRLPLAPALRPRLAEIEQEVEAAATLGPSALRALPPETLFFWLGKICYGIFVTELQQQQQPLIKPEYPLAENKHLLRRFQTFFQLLQGLRLQLEYPDYAPASIFVIESEAEAGQPDFAFDDDLNTLVFSVRLGRSVLIACLYDAGLISQPLTRVYAGAVAAGALHPAQVAEFKARVYYAAYLLAVVPDLYPRAGQAGEQPVVLDMLIDDVTNAIFNPWENLAYAHTLQGLWARWRLTESQILGNGREPLSLLFNGEGQVRPVAEAARMLAEEVLVTAEHIKHQ